MGTKPPIESALSNVVQAENGTFMVTIDPDGGTPFLIADLDDPAIMKQYTAANQARNEALIRTGANQQVDVLVTFAHPVTWREFVALREETGLTPFQYYFAEIRADGEKVVNFHRAVPDDELLASVSRQLERDGAELLGVMVVEGSVQASSAALGRLLSFPSVLLADTTWIDAVDLLVRHGYPVRQVDEGLDVSLTTPYWDLDWAPGS